MTINSFTCTLPKSHTRPMSLRARSTSMTCSARSFGSASNSFSSAASSSVGFAAPPRAGNGANFHLAILATHMNFRRRADERESVQFQQKHVGRRIDGAHGAINVNRRRLDRRGKPLRTDDLDDVARGDVFLGLEHVGKKLFPCDFGLKRNRRHFVRHADRMVFARLFEQRYQPLDFADGIFVSLGRAPPHRREWR